MSTFTANQKLVVLRRTGGVDARTVVTFVRDSAQEGRAVVKETNERLRLSKLVPALGKLRCTEATGKFKVGDVVTFERFSNDRNLGMKLSEDLSGKRYDPRCFESIHNEQPKAADAPRKFKDGQKVRVAQASGPLRQGQEVTIERYSRARGHETEVKVSGHNFDRFPESIFVTLEAAPAVALGTKIDANLPAGTKLFAVRPVGTLKVGDSATFRRMSTVLNDQLYVDGQMGRLPVASFSTTAPTAVKNATAEKLAQAIEKLAAAGTKEILVTATADGFSIKVLGASVAV